MAASCSTDRCCAYSPPVPRNSTEIPEEGLPPAGFSAWFLRRDQAEALADMLDEHVPDGADAGIYMRSGAHSIDRSVSGWSVCFDDDLEHHAREVATTFVVELDPDASGDVPIFAADLRHLGENGRPAGRNEPCRCGSDRKAKKCRHEGRPLILGTSYLLASQPEWGAFVAAMGDERWESAPELIPHGMYRVALSYTTVDGATLITTTVDAPMEADPNYAADMAEGSLAEGLSTVLPFLADARLQITVVPADENPGAA